MLPVRGVSLCETRHTMDSSMVVAVSEWKVFPVRRRDAREGGGQNAQLRRVADNGGRAERRAVMHAPPNDVNAGSVGMGGEPDHDAPDDTRKGGGVRPCSHWPQPAPTVPGFTPDPPQWEQRSGRWMPMIVPMHSASAGSSVAHGHASSVRQTLPAPPFGGRTGALLRAERHVAGAQVAGGDAKQAHTTAPQLRQPVTSG